MLLTSSGGVWGAIQRGSQESELHCCASKSTPWRRMGFFPLYTRCIRPRQVRPRHADLGFCEQLNYTGPEMDHRGSEACLLAGYDVSPAAAVLRWKCVRGGSCLAKKDKLFLRNKSMLTTKITERQRHYLCVDFIWITLFFGGGRGGTGGNERQRAANKAL